MCWDGDGLGRDGWTGWWKYQVDGVSGVDGRTSGCGVFGALAGLVGFRLRFGSFVLAFAYTGFRSICYSSHIPDM